MKLPRLLIIDDDRHIPPLVKRALKDTYLFDIAVNGAEGWEKVQELKPDIILCDYEMPVMNGAQLCKIVKTDIEYRHIPFVMLTGSSDDLGWEQFLIVRQFHVQFLTTFEPAALFLRYPGIQKRYIFLDEGRYRHL